MLPDHLRGPGTPIDFESPDTFLEENARKYPNLDPDFILQICFEHPSRFDSLFPQFDPRLHDAGRWCMALGLTSEMVGLSSSTES